jgi:hypothetical protein
MRLIVHIGFHKTASTHLQGLMNANHAALAARGIWYDPQSGYPAHHSVAHALMQGDSAPFEPMIVAALSAGAETLILSSEDLECALFNPAVPALIEEVAASFAIRDIEWHAAIREPGAYFESLHAQLSWHTFADALHMFSEVMKKGVLFMPEPFSGDHATPYWFYCFDYQPFLQAFAAGGRSIFVHDYADGEPYPGWRLIDRLGALDAMVKPAAAIDGNHRLSRAAVVEHFEARIHDVVGAEDWPTVQQIVAHHVTTDLQTVPTLARLIGNRFAESYRAAIRAFGRTATPVEAMDRAA